MPVKSSPPRKGTSSYPCAEPFEMLFLSHPLPMWVYDLKTLSFLEVNDAAVEKYGYSREEFLQMTIKDIRPAEEVPRLEKDLKRKHPTLQHSGQWIHKLKDGRVIDVEITSHTIEYNGRKAVLVTAQDVTERMRAELVLRASEERYRDLVENISDLICTHDLQGRLLTINRAAVELTGYSLDELVGRNLRDFIAPENHGALDNYLTTIRETGYASGMMSIRTRSGEKRIWEFHNTLRVQEGAEPVVRGYARDITERRLAEKEVNEREARYRNLFEDSPVSLWEEDFSAVKQRLDELKAEGVTDFRAYFASHPDVVAECISLVKVLDVNKATLDLYEAASKQELVGNLGRFFVDATYNNFIEELLHMAAGLTEFSWTGVNRTMNGKQIDVNLQWSVVPGHEQILDRVIVSLVNITKRKQAEKELKESESKYRTLIEQIPAIVYLDLLDGRGTTLFVSPQVESILGVTVDEWMEQDSSIWLNLIHPEDRQKAQNAYHSLTTVGQGYEIEYRVTSRQGSNLWIHDKGIVRQREDGQLLLQGVMHDITRQKQVETALRESEARFRGYFELPLVGFAINSPTTQWLDANPALCNMLGYTKDELIQKNWKEITYPDDLPANMEKLNRALNGEIDNYNMEKRFIRKDGSLIYVDMAVHCLRRPDRTIDYLMSLFLDVTERKQAEEKIRQMNVELEQRVAERTRELRETQEQLIQQEKLAVLGKLASGVGHELRNPLAIINNAVYFLKLVQPEASQKIRDYHAIIEKETHTAEKIITDLLDFARIKSVDREAVSVSELVERVLERFPVPPALTVSLNIPTDLPKVFVDSRQMEQVLGNLLINACQAMPEGGRLSVISDHALVDGEEWVQIAVRDTGVGIAPENMKRLFEPLFTTKLKGIGLGLAVSKKLAEANGGRIEVQSEAGAGSTFTLWLPIQQERKS